MIFEASLVQMEIESPEQLALIFIGKKERPQEAPFIPYKNRASCEDL